jgi:hypothetical protein
MKYVVARLNCCALNSEEKTAYQATRLTNTGIEPRSRFSLNFQVSHVSPGHPEAILTFDTNMLLP